MTRKVIRVSTDISNSLSNSVKEVKEFMWRDQRNNLHPVSSMHTRHLCSTLKMIWNHTVPELYKLRPFKRYSFSTFYTREYMIEAVRTMMEELAKRDDLGDYLFTITAIQHNMCRMLDDGVTTFDTRAITYKAQDGCKHLCQ